MSRPIILINDLFSFCADSSPVVMADNGSPVYTHTFTGLVSDALYTVSVVSNGTSNVKRRVAVKEKMIVLCTMQLQS